MENLQTNFNELISLLKDVKQALADKELSVKVDAPIVNVEPTPVNVTEREIPSQIEARVINLAELSESIKGIIKEPSKTLNIGNAKDFKVDSVSVKNLTAIEKLLKDILKKDANVQVKLPSNALPLDMRGYDPKKYVPVRLTDGEQFYNALSSITSSISKAGLITFAFDRVEVTAYNDNNDPTQVKYYYNSYLKGTLDITYDGSNRITNAVLS